MKSLTVFLQLVLEESGTWCDISTARDQEKIARRVEKEGISFYTITLPNFGKDFEKALDQGFVDPTLFMGFSRPKKGEWLPSFMKGFTGRIFDASTGRLLLDPDKQAIKAVRQCTYLFSKVGLECSPGRVRKAIRAYKQCEEELVDYDRNFTSSADRKSVV